MKITISTNEVLERLYAVSALHSYVNDTGGGDTTNILSPAQAPALRVIVRSAFSAAMSYLAFSGWKPDAAGGELCALPPDTLPVDADGAKAALTDAVTLLTLHIVYSAAADGRATGPTRRLSWPCATSKAGYGTRPGSQCTGHNPKP